MGIKSGALAETSPLMAHVETVFGPRPPQNDPMLEDRCVAWLQGYLGLYLTGLLRTGNGRVIDADALSQPDVMETLAAKVADTEWREWYGEWRSNGPEMDMCRSSAYTYLIAVARQGLSVKPWTIRTSNIIEYTKGSGIKLSLLSTP